MKIAALRVGAGAFALAAIAIVGLVPRATSQDFRRSGPSDPGVRQGPAAAGLPLPGLTPGQLSFFNEGKDAFEEAAFVQDPPADADAGLGPGFNSDSCESCHAFPTVGGTSPAVNPQIEAGSKMGARNQIPYFLRPDGPVLEVRFKRNRDSSPDGGVHNLFTITGRADAPGCNLPQEDFSNRSNLSFRTVTPTFGLGLVEAIPDAYLRANLNADRSAKANLGIGGHFNTNDNDGTITRFGWKAQVKSLTIFSGEAYNVEMGVSSLMFPQERNETESCYFSPTPEDSMGFDDGELDDIPLFAAFMRFLAPPARGPITPAVKEGSEIFARTGCALCHTQTLRTGPSSMAALDHKPVPLFSDLAVHKMGSGLADDIAQGHATGDEFRTAPLWGLGQRIFFLHDGRTKDLVAAILAHASAGNRQYGPSEANAVIRRFQSLSRDQQEKLLLFLRSL